MQHRVKRRVTIGDIIEVATPKGLAYAQYTHRHDEPPRFGDLIRVLPGLYDSRPSSFADLVEARERFCVFFPLRDAVRQAVVTVVAQHDVPSRCRPFPMFRDGIRNPATGRVDTWWLWDGVNEWEIGQLSPDQYHLPLREIWNDTMLIDRIAQGWTPEDER